MVERLEGDDPKERILSKKLEGKIFMEIFESWNFNFWEWCGQVKWFVPTRFDVEKFLTFVEVDQFGTNGEEKVFTQQMGGSLRTCMVVRSLKVVSKMNVTDVLLGLGPKYEFNCSFKKILTETWLSVFGMGVGTWPNDRLYQNGYQGPSKPCFVSTREVKTCRVFSFDYLRLLTTNLSSVD